MHFVGREGPTKQPVIDPPITSLTADIFWRHSADGWPTHLASDVCYQQGLYLGIRTSTCTSACTCTRQHWRCITLHLHPTGRAGLLLRT